MKSALGRRHRRAWLILVWGLMGFVLIQASLSAIMERWQPGLRDREYGVKLTRLRERLAENSRRPLVLVLGSSRVGTGLRAMPERNGREAAVEPLVFNVGIRGGGPLMELLCLQRLLAEGVKPDCVVLEFWPPNWCNEDERLVVCRLGWEDGLLLIHYMANPSDFTQRWLAERMLPCYSSRFTILNQFAPSWAASVDGWDNLLDGSGWRANPVPKNRDHSRELLLKAWKNHESNLRTFQIPESSDRALRDTLSLCQQRGIAASLLFMPESRGFQACYPPAVWTEVRDYLESMARESGATVIDCRDWMAEGDLADGFHLVPAGAARFSARFAREVLPQLARTSQGIR